MKRVRSEIRKRGFSQGKLTVQQEAETERDRLQAILDSMDDGIFIVGRDYRIEFMNLALRSEMGDGEGRFCHDFFSHERAICEDCQHGMSSFGPDLRREWYLAATGKTYDLAVSPIHKPDGEIARLHILRDITERKRLESKLQEYSQSLEQKVAEQAEKLVRHERLALLGEISAGLAHEIRTPLGAIITGIKLLEKGGQQAEDRELIFGLLKRETARLEKKVAEFLAYARGRTPLFIPTDVALLFKEVQAVLSTDTQLLGNVNLRVKVATGSTTWPLDADQIKEALLNLSTNALQAMQGTGTLTLEARFHENMLEILVRDNGPGIPLDAIPHIFRPFYSRRHEGTGLGLAICKEIIESHGGRIEVTSIPRRNTTFRITIPRA